MGVRSSWESVAMNSSFIRFAFSSSAVRSFTRRSRTLVCSRNSTSVSLRSGIPTLNPAFGVEQENRIILHFLNEQPICIIIKVPGCGSWHWVFSDFKSGRDTIGDDSSQPHFILNMHFARQNSESATCGSVWEQKGESFHGRGILGRSFRQTLGSKAAIYNKNQRPT